MIGWLEKLSTPVVEHWRGQNIHSWNFNMAVWKCLKSDHHQWCTWGQMLRNGHTETYRNVMEQLLSLNWAKPSGWPYILLCSINVTCLMVSSLVTKPPFYITTGALKRAGTGIEWVEVRWRVKGKGCQLVGTIKHSAGHW